MRTAQDWNRRFVGCLALSLCLASLRGAPAVNYSTEIQPIFEKHCHSCHGAEKQKSGLRLDLREAALAGGDSGKAIVPGKSAESLLVRYISGLDPDNVMPPKGEPLKPEEVGKIRAWIDGGAKWPEESGVTHARKTDHWAFRAPVRAELPAVKDASWVRTPVDAFLLARLEKEKIKPSREAERTTLIRRLTMDLLGLVPTPEETAAFVSDRRPDAYERLVDRLLASPHFGERWGRHWLDLARYADSDGYEKDSPRPYAYLFRDWVIEAINRDLPYDQFTIEQIAGDLLPEATEKQKLATAFQRQTLTNREGGVDKEEFRCKATVDRVNTTATVWLGLTAGCAECHTHKYDPITQREYFQLYAFFNNASEKDIPAPQPRELADYNKQLAAWEKKLAEFEKPLAEYLAGIKESKLPDWEKSLKIPEARWTTLKLEKVAVATEGDESLLQAGKDQSVTPRAKDPVRSRFTIDAVPGLKGITALRVEAVADPGKAVGRGAKGDFALSEFSAWIQPREGDPYRVEITSAKADVAATNGAASRAIDGDRNTGWSVGADTMRTHVIVFELKEPLEVPEGARLVVKAEQFTIGLMSRFRLAATAAKPPVEPTSLPDAIVALLDVGPAQRSAKQKAALTKYFAEQVDEEGIKLNKAVTAHHGKKPRYPETMAPVLVADQRKTQVHIRGDFLRKGDEVSPATPAVLNPLRARGRMADRLDLAQWLVAPENPLTARVAVNHVWKVLFGRGLVTTVNDFGTRGEKPSHPELLDWLAVTFRSGREQDGGLAWSRKGLVRLIVTSAAYRQASDIREELMERDANNVLLARQNRFRVEAETVRDVYLAASGLLNPAVGGPSIRPQLPADIAALGYANSVKWQESKGAEKYRRGLYIFFQRTVPYPMLMTFDAPDSNTSCTRRERSNTPLQALTLLNDPVFFECAQALGKRVAAEAAPAEKKIQRAFELCLSREPSGEELSRLTKLYADHIALLNKHPENAARITAEKEPGPEVIEGAAMIAVSRVIMNLDEFVTRE